MDLINYMKDNPDLANMPSGLHAVVPADTDRGLTPGVIFTLRNRNQGVNINQQNRLHPYYLIYISEDGGIVANHTEVKQLLDTVRSACKSRKEPVNVVCRLFNENTDDGRNMEFYSGLLQQAIRAMINLKEEDDIDSLFKGNKSSALTHTISGLNDFELINFLVVKAAA
jgi:hypothetical protein